MIMQAVHLNELMTMIDLNTIKQEYPPIISSEQLRKLLHVSKRRCVWLMKNYIPHTDNGNMSRRYTIRLDDAIEFIRSFEQSPESYAAPKGQFTSKHKPYIMPNISAKSMHLLLMDEWSAVPELLDPTIIGNLIGYSENSVNRWLEKGILRSVLTQGGRVTSKEWLCEFLCNEGMRIAKKSDWHITLLRSFSNDHT